DVNGDGHLDIMMVGNDYGNEVFSGRYDAREGLILLGDGSGSFSELPSGKSGFSARGDAKALAVVAGAEGRLIVPTQNADSLRVFGYTEGSGTVFKPLPRDSQATLVHADGRREKIEFYYGSGYLSQSSRSVL